LNAFSTREVVELRFATDDHEEYFDQLTPFAERVEVLPDRVLLYVHNGDEALARVHAAHITPSSTLVRRSSLEDVFLHLTGRSLTE
jgi:lipooligosaccharide transport system ATP-binding protein